MLEQDEDDQQQALIDAAARDQAIHDQENRRQQKSQNDPENSNPPKKKPFKSKQIKKKFIDTILAKKPLSYISLEFYSIQKLKTLTFKQKFNLPETITFLVLETG